MPTNNFLLLHGALATQEEMQTLKELLLEKNQVIHELTFSGHGKNSSAKEFRIETFAQDIENFITENQLKDVHLFGYSMGGYAALYYQVYAENPKAKSITTYGTKFDWSVEVVRREIPKLDPQMIAAKAPQFKGRLVNYHGENWEKVLTNTSHMMEHLEKLDGLTAVDLSSIEIPVVLMLGDEDKMVTLKETEEAVAQLTNAAVLKVPSSPHDFSKADMNFIVNFLCHQH